MFTDLITHGYLFNQIMFINSITHYLYIYGITLYYLNFPLSLIIFKQPSCGIFHWGPTLQFKFHLLLIQVSLID